jgi:cell division protein YceG involved in septum cleavage
VATNLESLGLIKSQQDFLTKLEELKLGNSIKANTYKIKTESSIDEIISILTK